MGSLGIVQRVKALVGRWRDALAGQACTVQEAIEDLQRLQAAHRALRAHQAWTQQRAAAELLAAGIASRQGERYRCPMHDGPC